MSEAANIAICLSLLFLLGIEATLLSGSWKIGLIVILLVAGVLLTLGALSSFWMWVFPL
jgi:hypothetical protein